MMHVRTANDAVIQANVGPIVGAMIFAVPGAMFGWCSLPEFSFVVSSVLFFRGLRRCNGAAS